MKMIQIFFMIVFLFLLIYLPILVLSDNPTWWDSSFLNMYDLNISNPDSVRHQNYGLELIDVSGVTCNSGDRLELRSLFDNTTVQGIMWNDSSHTSIYALINYTADVLNSLSEDHAMNIYCNNPSATNVAYVFGNVMTFDGLVNNENITVDNNSIMWSAGGDGNWTLNSPNHPNKANPDDNDTLSAYECPCGFNIPLQDSFINNSYTLWFDFKTLSRGVNSNGFVGILDNNDAITLNNNKGYAVFFEQESTSQNFHLYEVNGTGTNLNSLASSAFDWGGNPTTTVYTVKMNLHEEGITVILYRASNLNLPLVELNHNGVDHTRNFSYFAGRLESYSNDLGPSATIDNVTFVVGANISRYNKNDIITVGALQSQIGTSPLILNNISEPNQCSIGNQCNLTVHVNDTDITDILIEGNFSLTAPNGSIIINNINGTFINVINPFNEINWTSLRFIPDDGGTWSGNFTVYDDKGNSNSTEIDVVIADSLSPNITLDSPINNQAVSSSSVDFNFSIIDDLTDEGNFNCYAEFNQSGVNESISNCNNFTLTSLPLNQDLNVTLIANDSYGNWGSSGLINYTTTTDISNPSMTITSPTASETFTGTTPFNITLNATITDNSNLDTCFYEVPLESIANTTYTCNVETSFEVNNYGTRIVNVYSNDTSGNMGTSSQTFSTSQSGGSGSTGGGGGTTPSQPSFSVVGESCVKDEECSTKLCDLFATKTCVLTTIGNGICDNGKLGTIDRGETIQNAQEDCSPFSIAQQQLEFNPFLKILIPLTGLLIFFLIVSQSRLGKTIKSKYNKAIGGKN